MYVPEHNHAGICIMQGFASCRDLRHVGICIIMDLLHLAGQKVVLTRLPSQRHLIWQD